MISRFSQPPARARRLYLRRPHRVYTLSEWQAAWAAAARKGSQVFVAVPSQRPLIAAFAPPAGQPWRHRLAAEHTSRGAAFGITIRAYAAP